MPACPCDSGSPYTDCCAPFHRGAREAPDAAALMRSRYSAFAMKEVEYLWRTLHADHDDRAQPKEAVLSALRQTCASHKYMGLTILDTRPADAHGVARVLFAAKVFHRGRDLSFVECSEFLHDGVGWRYLRGDAAPRNAIGNSDDLTIDTFLARAT